MSKNTLLLILIFITTTLLSAFAEGIMDAFNIFFSKEINFYLEQLLFFVQVTVITTLAIRFTIYLVGRWFYRTYSAGIPKILENLLAILLWIVIILLILSFGYDISVNTIVATSGLSIAILGFAVKSLLMDFFSGIAMGIERAFDIGDWIEIEKDIIGRVIGMNWRAVRLVTIENKEIVIPNNELASKFFINYNKPTTYFRASTTIVLEYGIASHQAERILLSAASFVEEVEKAPNKPKVVVKNFTYSGVEWELMFWIKDYSKQLDIVYEIEKNILRNLYFAGLEVPPERSRLFSTVIEMQMENRQSVEYFLQRIDLFGDLNKDELSSLASSAKKRFFLQGKTVVEQGEEGDSLFVIIEGLVSVGITKEDMECIEVAKLGSGDFFGEMSLLTGEPRSAKVVAHVDTALYEIKRDDLKPILEGRKEPLESISTKLAERKMQNDKKLSKISIEQKEIIKSSIKFQFRETISKFFDLLHNDCNTPANF